MSEHCDHEVVCWMYRENKIPQGNQPCMRNHYGCITCTADTRSRQHPASAPDTKYYFDAGWEKGAKAAREDVLDLIEKWIKEDACPPGKKKGKRCDKGCAMCFVESLRTHQQAGDGDE